MSASEMNQVVTGATIFDGERFLEDHCVVVRGQRIVRIVRNTLIEPEWDIEELDGGVLAPGFIDIQVNGGGGVMLNNSPCAATVNTMTAAHRPTGTTGMMPTLISDTREVQQAGVEAVHSARNTGNRSVLGVHIEGPFFSADKRGTHKASMIRPLEQPDIEWLGNLPDAPTILTLAPEQTRPGQIRQLSKAGIRVFAGHTNASYQQIEAAMAEGLQGFTHLFNAMSPLHAREPGAVGAALDSGESWVSIIADGHHVHPASIRIAHRAKPAGKLLLVTDAMATVGSAAPYVEIYGERIDVCDGRLVNAEGVLAGSAIGMIDAVKTATQVVGLPLDESLRMASLYPATLLALQDGLGRLAPGFRADMVHFDDNYRVMATWVAGHSESHARGEQL